MKYAKEDIDYFISFCINTFSEFYNIDKELVVKVSHETGLIERFRKHYDVLHTQGHLWLVEEMLEELREPLNLKPFEEKYNEMYIVNLYHGTHLEFDKVDLSKCRSTSDFGKAFYLTPELNKAAEWAEARGRAKGSYPVVYQYEFNKMPLNLLKVKKFDSVNEEWAKFISSCRTLGRKFSHGFDIVIGPVADDKVYDYTSNYLKGQISTEQFVDLAKPYESFTQYAFCSEDAIATTLNKIRRIDMG